MPSYLVETHVPARQAHDARAAGRRARAPARELAREGASVVAALVALSGVVLAVLIVVGSFASDAPGDL